MQVKKEKNAKYLSLQNLLHPVVRPRKISTQKKGNNQKV